MTTFSLCPALNRRGGSRDPRRRHRRSAVRRAPSACAMVLGTGLGPLADHARGRRRDPLRRHPATSRERRRLRPQGPARGGYARGPARPSAPGPGRTTTSHGDAAVVRFAPHRPRIAAAAGGGAPRCLSDLQSRAGLQPGPRAMCRPTEPSVRRFRRSHHACRATNPLVRRGPTRASGPILSDALLPRCAHPLAAAARSGLCVPASRAEGPPPPGFLPLGAGARFRGARPEIRIGGSALRLRSVGIVHRSATIWLRYLRASACEGLTP